MRWWFNLGGNSQQSLKKSFFEADLSCDRSHRLSNGRDRQKNEKLRWPRRLTVQLWFLLFSCDFWSSSVMIFHSSIVIFHSSVEIFHSSIVIFRLDERDWNLRHGNWDRRVFFSRYFGRRRGCSLVCVWRWVLVVKRWMRDGCYNKANCPRGNQTSGWICLYEFWSSDPWTKPPNGKPTVWIAWPHQRSLKIKGKKRKNDKWPRISIFFLFLTKYCCGFN